MKNLTLKITALLILALSSPLVMAKSPWADEEPVAAEPVSVDPFADSAPAEPEAVQNEPAPAPVAVQQETIAPVTAPTESPTESVENFDSQPQTQTQETYTQETTQTRQGDVLNVNDSGEMVAVRILDFPRRGMSTDKVKNELGQPGEIISGIGQPPISRWIYDDRTVYFEYSTVLHVVAK